MDQSFIFEAPGDRNTSNRKKRLRLVTACDNCRARKIKCRSDGETQCQACVEAGIECLFRDKEHYYSNRGLAPSRANSSGAPSRAETPSSQGAFTNSDTALSLTPVEALYGDADTSQSAASVSRGARPRNQAPLALGKGLVPAGYEGRGRPDPNIASHEAGREVYYQASEGGEMQAAAHPHTSAPSARMAASPAPNAAGQAAPELFDPVYPSYPHPTLMPFVIQAFFQHLAHAYRFLEHDDIVRAYLEGDMDAPLACAIAALAVPYMQGSPQLGEHDPFLAAEAYNAHAKAHQTSYHKILLPAAINEVQMQDYSILARIDVLHAAILIAWAEWSSGRADGFAYYSQVAVTLALNIGINDPARVTVLSNDVDYEAQRLAITWTAVAQLAGAAGISTEEARDESAA